MASTVQRLFPFLVLFIEITGCGPLAMIAPGFMPASGGKSTYFLVGPALQNATPDAATVMWETEGEDETKVEWGLTTELEKGVASGETMPSRGGTVLHHARLTGLTPDTTYFYKARTGDAYSPIQRMRTPPVPGAKKPFRFAVYSDCQQKPGVHAMIVERGIRAKLPQGAPADGLAFALVAGDIVQDGDQYWQYRDRFFEPTRSLSGQVPFYATIGNHELDSPIYFDYLDLPKNGTPGYEEHWYSFDYANTHVIGLDTNEDFRIDAQLAWLEKDLDQACAAPTTDFVFAYFHHPFKSELWLAGETAYTGEIVQRFEAKLAGCGKMGAYFFGHTHGYSRGQSQDNPIYAVNVGSAGGGIDRWNEHQQRDYPEFQKSIDEYGVLIVEVNFHGRDLAATRYGFGDNDRFKDAEVQDQFGLRYGNGGPAQPVLSGASVAGPGGTRHVALEGGVFRDPDGDPMLESQWQLAPAADAFATPVAGAWLRRENWYRERDTMAGVDIRRAALPAPVSGGHAWARVRYRDESLAWSPWSAPVTLGSSVAAR